MNCRLLAATVIALLIISFFANNSRCSAVTAEATPNVYVGIDAAYGDLDKIEELVNNVSSYTNLFVIGCRAITSNAEKLEKTCQYLYDKGLYFIIFQEDALGRIPFLSIIASDWTQTAKNRWGDHFLGFYYMDELGGKQLDLSSWTSIKSAKNYQDMTNQYIARVRYYLDWFKAGYSSWTDVSLFTSDYALYWYDYKGGYDTVFAEYGWNNSRQLNTALCRGAATAQGKEWGAMITWTYTTSPFIESGDELYKDMVYAYNNGAKYIVVFDSNEDYTQGILTEEHLNALKQFWTYIRDNPRDDSAILEGRSAVVLPENFAQGFRYPQEKIWGLWKSDNTSQSLYLGINSLLEQYGTKLDIIYEDGLNLSSLSEYDRLIYLDDSSKFTSSSPMPVSLEDQTIWTLLANSYPIIILAVAIAVLASLAVIMKKKLRLGIQTKALSQN